MADINVRSLPDEVVARLQSQAAAAGLSMSEFIRQALVDRAQRLTTEEIAEMRAARRPSEESRRTFDDFYSARLNRRRSA